MARPLVAIVGRPNVGKSMLFNRLVGQRLSIVEDTPGVTRDRLYAECEWCGRKFDMVDTGGIEPTTDSEILLFMREQAQIAIDAATVIILVTDLRTGVTAADKDVANMLLRSKKPVVLAVNKADSTGATDLGVYEFYSLGLGDPIPVSAVHGHGTGDLLDECLKYFPDPEDEEEEDDLIHVAIIGKPNVGKSSLVNHILGEKRVIVSDMAGTTRDAVDTVYENELGSYMFIDTAGIRRKSKVDEPGPAGHRAGGRLPHHDRRTRRSHRPGYQDRRACPRGGQSQHHRGQQVGPGREGDRDHGEDAQGHHA